MYERSIFDPDKFWGEHGRALDWPISYADIPPYFKTLQAQMAHIQD